MFEPVAAESYTNKVKTLLTGGAVTDAELKAVVADPSLAQRARRWLARNSRVLA